MEFRKNARTLTNRPGSIIVGPDTREIACIVTDLSQAGAGLHVASVLGIPETFELLIRDETERRLCRLVWKEPNRVGVAFVARKPLGG